MARPLCAERNELGRAFVAGAAGEPARERSLAIKANLGTVEPALAACASALAEAAGALPNESHPDAPLGPEAAARTVRTFGTRPSFDFAPADHVALGEALRMFDFPGGARIAGSKFVVLTGDGVWLELALVSWCVRGAM